MTAKLLSPSQRENLKDLAEARPVDSLLLRFGRVLARHMLLEAEPWDDETRRRLKQLLDALSKALDGEPAVGGTEK